MIYFYKDDLAPSSFIPHVLDIRSSSFSHKVDIKMTSVLKRVFTHNDSNFGSERIVSSFMLVIDIKRKMSNNSSKSEVDSNRFLS